MIKFNRAIYIQIQIVQMAVLENSLSHTLDFMVIQNIICKITNILSQPHH